MLDLNELRNVTSECLDFTNTLYVTLYHLVIDLFMNYVLGIRVEL